MRRIRTLTKKFKLIVAVTIAVIILATVAVIINKPTIKAEFSEAERLLATRETNGNKTEEDIYFNAFFLRDTDGDGNAEEFYEVDNELDKQTYLYSEIIVNTEGYLKDGKISIEAGNFILKTNLVSSNIVDGNHIGQTNEIKLQNLPNGTQALLYGSVESNIDNNINNYNKDSKVIFTGIFVDDEGNETNIEKVINLKVNWYGTTRTDISSLMQKYNIDNAIKEETFDVTFKIQVNERNKQLLLEKQEIKAVIPKLSGYNPISVELNNSNVQSNYNEESGILTINRESTIDENGNVIQMISDDFSSFVSVKYPIEAFNEIEEDYVILDIQEEASTYGFNSKKEGYTNPHVSTARSIVTASFEHVERPEISGEKTINKWYASNVIGWNYKDIDGLKYKAILKDGAINLYNGNIYNENTTSYPVYWNLQITNQVDIEKVIIQDETNNLDCFHNSSGINESMRDFVTIKSIAFEGLDTVLGENGWVRVYNADNNSLISKMSVNTWKNYSKANPYTLDGVKSIRVETSAPVGNGKISVYQLKSIDNEKVVEYYSTRDYFDDLKYIYTFMTTTIETSSGEIDTHNSAATALYKEQTSNVALDINKDEFLTDSTENINLTIETYDEIGMERWKDGIFVIEFPEEIVDININEVSASNENVNILSYQLYSKNNKKYIRINTQNDEALNYSINVDADVYTDPISSSVIRNVNLYAYNNYCDNYDKKVEDIYDIDGDQIYSDYVAYNNKTIKIYAPLGLITSEYITNYDENNSKTVAPNVAEIDKERENATINIRIANNYDRAVSDIVILGKVPFEGNEFVLNNRNLGSEFTANIVGPISVPDELVNANVYYSTEENPSRDLEDESNGWLTADEVEEWNSIKTYMIDFGSYRLSNGQIKDFSYLINIPDETIYNKKTYSTHAVYYALETDNGLYHTSVQPNKVGIEIVKRFDLELTKNKMNFDNILVKGAQYSVTYTDVNGNEVSKLASTDENGKLVIEDLHFGKECIMQEISCSNDYVLDVNTIKFIANLVNDGEDDNLELNVLSGNFKNEPVKVLQENGKYVVKAGVEDEAKYSLIINKKNGTDLLTDKVTFTISGKDKADIYKTVDGITVINGLYLNEEYKLIEVEADGYYVDGQEKIFKIIRDGDTKELEIVSDDLEISSGIINENINGQSQVSVTIQNEKIPKYNLQIVKVKKNKEDSQETVPLSGAVFKLSDSDSGIERNYTTDANGCINISNLNKYVDGKYLSGIYTIQEVYPPEGYISNPEQIKFKVTSNSDGSSEFVIENRDSMTSIKDVVFENNVLKITIEDLPTLNITKIDSETEEKMPNVGFTIQNVDIVGNVIGYAKDGEGNYIGKINENGEYIVVTDENGMLELPIKEGNYKLKEVETPEGYESNEPIFFSIGQDDTGEIIIIKSIEDLVDFSNNVSNGDKYSEKTILLAKTLDFNNDSSYDDPTSTEYGDLNGDGTIENIKTELTKTSGKGFTPIGSGFRGTFNGNGNEINNLYINRNQESEVGLFSNGAGTVKNLGISGTIKCTYNYRNSDYEEVHVGAIAGTFSGRIINCHSSATVTATTTGNKYNSFTFAGGIVGLLGSDYAIIYNCYNTGNISTNNAIISFSGGIAGSSFGSVSSCYNTGNITGGCVAGGITGAVRSYGIRIRNCYNTGKIVNNAFSDSNYAGSGGIEGPNNAPRHLIENCYNIGSVQGKDSYQLADSYANIYNSYYLAETSDGNEAIDEFELISKEFYEKLNVNDVWHYDIGSNPKLLNISNILDTPITEENIIVKNKLKTFNITTEVDGGIGGSISGQNDEVYETIKYNYNNLKEIVMTPNDGYKIVNISVNGKEIQWDEDNNGNYTIPADYFTNVKEDIHVVVKYYKKNQTLTIKKVDADNEDITLSGARFEIEENLRNDFEIVNQNDMLSEPKDDSYGGLLKLNNSGEYVTNTLTNKSYLSSRFSIDLTNKKGTYYAYININYYVRDGAGAYAYLYTDGVSGSTSIYSLYNKYGSNIYKTSALEGGKKYTISLVVQNGNASTVFKLNSLTVEGDLKTFKNEDDVYISQNKGISNSYSYVCMPIDLSSYTEDWNLKINAEISSEINNDIGYAIVSQSDSIPSYSETDGRFIYISGNVEAKNYTTTLQGGNKYYLHIGYYKNDSGNSGTDTFTINDINLSNEVTTNENGEILLSLLEKEYRVTEIEAPENYILNSETQTITLGNNNDNELTFANKQKPKVIVHHYLKDNEEYTNKKVAKDEIIYGDLDKEYTTEPHIDLKKLNIEKDLEGNYVIPENARGVYSNEDIEVNYYYEAEPIKLTIKHLVEGTEDRIVEDEIIETNPTVSFDENGNYNVSINKSYELSTNENYNFIIQNYDLAYIHCDLKDTVWIEDTIQYSEDTEIIYYYDAMPIKYYIHYFYDGIEDLSKLEEKTGYINIPVNSYRDKAGIGYYFEKTENLPLIPGEDISRNYINVYYLSKKIDYSVQKMWNNLSEDEAQNYRVTFKLYKKVNNDNYNIEIDGKRYTEVTEWENKVVVGNGIVSFESLPEYDNEVKNEYIAVESRVEKKYENDEWKELDINGIDISNSNSSEADQLVTNSLKKLNYEVRYFYANKEDESLRETINAQYLDVIHDYPMNGKDKEGYEFERDENVPLTIDLDESKNIINVYFNVLSYEYRIEYYYDNKIDNDKTEYGVAEYGSKITEYPTENKGKEGYSIVKEKNLPLVIGTNTENNVIKIYYEIYSQDKIGFDVEKKWEGITNEEASNYRATFTLYQVINDQETPALDSNGDEITLTIRGNNEDKFTNVQKYVDSTSTEEIKYTIKETKVEYTKDNGTTWETLSEKRYTTQYKENYSDTLASKVQIGDYVNYNASSGDEVSFATVSSITGSPGSNNDMTFSNKSTESQNLKWRVLNVDSETGVVTLMAEEPVGDKRLALYGLTGARDYNNILNSISAVYGYGDGATGARSINKADFEKLSNYDYTEYSHTTSGGSTYGATKNFTSGTFVDGNGNTYEAPYTETLTGYTYTAQDYFSTEAYNMLFKNASDTSKSKNPYFVADLSKLIFKNEPFVNYSATAVNNGVFDAWYNDKTISGYNLRLYSSNGSQDYALGYVMPVVELQANIGTDGQDENSVWKITTDGITSPVNPSKVIVSNTILPEPESVDYTVKKTWSGLSDEDANNYRAIFTLQKMVNGEAQNVKDDQNHDIIIRIVGNNEETFYKLPKIDDDNNEIEYTVKESKIEKTTDGGQTWLEYTDEEVRAEYKFAPDSRILANSAQIGDYVNYNAYSADNTASYNVTGEVSGSLSTSNDVSFSNQTSEAKNMKWRVLNINNETGVVTLMAEEPLQSKVLLYGLTGAKYYKNTLNSISAVYGKGYGATMARSINKSDFDKLSRYNKTIYSHTTEGGGNYGDTKTITTGTFVDGEGNEYVAPHDETLTAYTYNANEYFDENVYNMLFKNATNTSSYKLPYYVADLGTITFNRLNFVNYTATMINNGVFDSWYEDKAVDNETLLMYRSNGGNSVVKGYVLPVVELQANIKVDGKDENGMWMLAGTGNETITPVAKSEEADATVTNTIIKKSTYEVRYFYDEVEDENERFLSDKIEIGTEISTYADKVHFGYELDKVFILDENNQEKPLPLEINEDSSKNIICVYYKKKVQSLKIEKKWNVSDSSKYRATFVLKRTIDGTSEVVTNNQNQPVTKTIEGNGIATFDKLPSYEGTSEITYSVEEIKVEKKNEFDAWVEDDLSSYDKIYSIESAGVLKPGDYVAYTPRTGESYTATADKTGTNSETFTVEDGTKWRVLKNDRTTGKTYLILDGVLSTELSLQGEAGHKNAKEILNNISALYATGNGAVAGKNVSLQDIEEYSVYNKTTYESSFHSLKYGTEQQYTKGEFFLSDGTKVTATGDSPITEAQTYYTYVPEQYFVDSNAYDTLFKKDSSNISEYWLEDYGVQLNSTAVDYYQYVISNGELKGKDLVNTVLKDNGDHNGWVQTAYVRPVIELSSDMVVSEKDESGAWVLRSSETASNSDYMKVTNTLLRDYKVKKEWNIKEVNDYKTTFTLYRRYENGAKAVTDDLGNIVTKTIIGEGEAAFSKLPVYDGENEIEYFVQETKIERKSADNSAQEEQWEEIPLSNYAITHEVKDGYDDVYTNKIVTDMEFHLNKLSDYTDDDVKYLPGAKFKVSIQDITDENNPVDLVDSSKEYITGEDGKFTEQIEPIRIENENKKYLIKIKELETEEGHKLIAQEIVARLSVKLSENGKYFELILDEDNLENVDGNVNLNASMNKFIVNILNLWQTGYTVNYLEESTNKVLSTAKVNDTAKYRSVISSIDEVIDIPGFNYVRANADSIQISATASENIINLYYEQKTNSNYIIHYKEQGTGDEVAPNKIGDEKAVGTIVEESPIDIPGYSKVDESSFTLEITPITAEHTFYYTKRNDLSYTVNYLEKDTNNVIKTAKFVDTATFEEVITAEAEIISIDGYNYVESDKESITIGLDASENVITLYYTKKTNLSYTVYYKDKDTEEEIADSKTVTDQTFGDKKTETAVAVEGYSKVAPETVEIEIKDATNEHTFYYTKSNDLSYTINYLEKDDDEDNTNNTVLHEARVVNTAVFNNIISVEDVKENIDGYNYVDADKESISIGLDASKNIMNLYYTKRADLSYTVHYLEKDTTNVIKDSKTVENNTFGDVITSESEKIDIPGYKYDSSEKENITIKADASENIINLYYTKSTDLTYTVNYLEKGTTTAIKTAKVVGGKTLGDVITTSVEKVDIAGYDYDSMDKEALTIGTEENVINIYYKKAKLAYTVHYFYDGVEDTAKKETLEAEFKSKISTYPTEGKSEGEKVFIKAQALGEDGNEKALPLTIGTDVSKNVINVYYRTAHKVITKVVDHTEKYKNGTTKTVKGGTISTDPQGYYEGVLNGDDITKPIVIKPDSGYEIAKVIIKTANGTEELDINSYKAEDGSITLTKDSHAYLRNITSNVEVIAEFARKTSVTVKYLEKDTKKKLAEPVTIKGVEGQLVNAKRAVVTDYREAQVTTTDSSKSTVTYENMDKFVETTGTMFADATTIVYWYEKIPEGTIVVKHIEIDEKDIKNGLTLTSGKEVSSDSYKGKVNTTKETARKELKDNVTGRKYISVNGPTSKDESIIIVGKDKNSYTAKYKEIDKDDGGKIDVVEVRYYYEKQYDITIDIKEHIENVNGTDIKVKGGTVVSKEGTLQANTKIVENVNNRATNTKEIVITPDKNYMIKAVFVNEKAIDISGLIDKNGVVTIRKGYFGEIKEDKNIVAEFQKIPTKVIVKYVDIDTKKEIKSEDTQVGEVGEKYKVERATITGYEKAGTEPINAIGTRTIEDIIVTYYYKKVEEKPSDEKQDGKTDIKDTTDTKTQESTTPVKPAKEESAKTEAQSITNINAAVVGTSEEEKSIVHKTANPYTGDNIKDFVGLFIVSAIGLIGISLLKKARRTKKQ